MNWGWPVSFLSCRACTVLRDFPFGRWMSAVCRKGVTWGRGTRPEKLGTRLRVRTVLNPSRPRGNHGRKHLSQGSCPRPPGPSGPSPPFRAAGQHQQKGGHTPHRAPRGVPAEQPDAATPAVAPAHFRFRSWGPGNGSSRGFGSRVQRRFRQCWEVDL